MKDDSESRAPTDGPGKIVMRRRLATSALLRPSVSSAWAPSLLRSIATSSWHMHPGCLQLRSCQISVQVSTLNLLLCEFIMIPNVRPDVLTELPAQPCTHGQSPPFPGLPSLFATLSFSHQLLLLPTSLVSLFRLVGMSRIWSLFKIIPDSHVCAELSIANDGYRHQQPTRTIIFTQASSRGMGASY